MLSVQCFPPLTYSLTTHLAVHVDQLWVATESAPLDAEELPFLSVTALGLRGFSILQVDPVPVLDVDVEVPILKLWLSDTLEQMYLNHSRAFRASDLGNVRSGIGE